MKKLVVGLMLLLFGATLHAQDVAASGVTLWRTLEEIDYEITQDEWGDLYLPVFSERIQALKGKTVEVAGFIIPFEEVLKPEYLILSALPVSACFFCGSGGPETVMEVRLKPGQRVKYTTKKIRIRGTLVLNKDNLDRLMYQLKDAIYAGYAEVP